VVGENDLLAHQRLHLRPEGFVGSDEVDPTLIGQRGCGHRLFIQRGDGTPVELTQLGVVQGAQELENGEDGLLGFSLSGERGPISLWLVAAEAPTSPETALEAIRLGGENGVVVAKVRVDVTP